MNVDKRLVCTYQSGNGDCASTLWRDIYEIGKYWIISCHGAMGQSIWVFLKEDIEDQKKDILIDFAFPKGNHKYTSGWWMYYESWEDAVKRNISAYENPNQILWFEKCKRKNENKESKEYGQEYDWQKLKFSIDASDENKKQIESSPDFIRWENQF